MKVFTAEGMRALDRAAMEQGGIPGAVLMENAGRAVFEVIAERYGPLCGKRVVIACGTGNNGGDGFVVARYLALSGASPQICIAGDPKNIKGDARVHLDTLRKCGVEPIVPGNAEDAASVFLGWSEPTVRVDALLGTGAKGAPRGPVADLISGLNRFTGQTVAIDVPSGVDADTGRVQGEAVRADVTVTLAYPKPGLLTGPGADLAGEIVVRDIGFVWESLGYLLETPYSWNCADSLRSMLPPRRRDAHKGDFGHLLVIGGSAGMSGAPTMAARAALRTGVGLVTVAAPRSAQQLIAAKLDEAMTVPLPEVDGFLAKAALEQIHAAAKRASALCIGPGIGSGEESRASILEAARAIDVPLILDADGLNALASAPESLRGRAADTVLTPHPGECARLLGSDTATVQADRVTAARECALKYAAVVVLKGARTLICDGRRTSDRPDAAPVAFNTNGNPGMATGGSGDTLAGVIGALLAQRLDAFKAARLGVYLHGRAADLRAAGLGEAGLLPTDVAEALPLAIRELQQSF